MKGNFPFRFWCHRVLPLVYDDSISYYEFLCKIAKLVNDISEHNEEQDIAIANNNEYIVKLDNEVHNDIVPHLENEISGLEQTLSGDIRNLAMRIGFTPYSIETEYHEGEYCLYLDKTADYEKTLRYGIPYVCTRDTSGEFDETAWNGTSVSDELNKNYLEISELGYKFIALLGSLAPNYDENETYIENDIVVYNDKVWICKNTATGEWDSDKWELNVLKVIMDKALNAENEAESALEKCDTLTTDYQNLSNTVGSISQSLNGLDTKVFYGFNSIADNYQEYSGTPLFYPKDSYVWYSDILYKANADVTVDSASVLPPDQNSSWDSVQLTDEIGSGGSGSFDITLLAENYDETNTYDYGECVSKDGKLYVCTATTATGIWDSSKWEETNAEGAFANKKRTMRELTELIAELSGGVQIDGATKNVPKYTLGYFAERERSNLYGRRLFYANKATVTGSGFIQQDWTQLLNVGLYGWVKLITDDISRYNETQTDTITDTMEVTQ